MKYIQGDPIFRRNGTPGIVRKIDKSKAEIKVDNNINEVKTRNHSYLQGASQDIRSRFNDIMDEISDVEALLTK